MTDPSLSTSPDEQRTTGDLDSVTLMEDSPKSDNIWATTLWSILILLAFGVGGEIVRRLI